MISRFNRILIGQGRLNQASAHNVFARGLVAGLALGLLGIAPEIAPPAGRPGFIWVPAAEAGTATAVDVRKWPVWATSCSLVSCWR